MKRLALVSVLMLMGYVGQAQDTIKVGQTTLVTKVLVDNMAIPWDMSWGPDGWIWFNERDGDIYRLNPDDTTLIKVFTLPDVFESWDNSGFHAMTLHPDFPITPYIFTHYTVGEFKSRLVRWTYDLTLQTLRDSVVIIAHIGGNSSHNGSRIVFDKDGYLFLSVGDAFVSQAAQDVHNTNGKILRMTQDGKIPEDNPIPGSFTWSFGHRNPQGLVFGKNDILYSSEHGDATDDEVNIIERGRNYGWPMVEGFCDKPSEIPLCDSMQSVEPLWAWTPTHAPCGIDYFDHASIPEWRNSLLVTFLKRQHLTVMPLSDDGRSLKSDTVFDYFVERYGRIRDVLVSPNGRVFIATSNQETNGQWVTPDNYDKIIEIVNPDYDYPEIEIQNYPKQDEAVIFPNPTKEKVLITLKTDNNELHASIYNSQGYLVRDQKVTTEFSGLWQVQLPDLPNDIYTLVYFSGDKTGRKKLVVETE
ncbi:MAG: PQQ-dependent sugar dehydrogenase [Flavobacteriales bacterium]